MIKQREANKSAGRSLAARPGILRTRNRKTSPARAPIVPRPFVDWIDEGGVRQAKFSPKLLRPVRGLSLDIASFLPRFGQINGDLGR